MKKLDLEVNGLGSLCGSLGKGIGLANHSTVAYTYINLYILKLNYFLKRTKV